MTMSSRPHWIATALTAAALALASQLALAHGGHHHEPAAVPRVAGETGFVEAGATAAPHAVEAVWSQSCPDGSGGGECRCKDQPVNPGVAKIAIAGAGGWTRPVPQPAVGPTTRFAETFPQQDVVSGARPRAPPHFS